MLIPTDHYHVISYVIYYAYVAYALVAAINISRLPVCIFTWNHGQLAILYRCLLCPESTLTGSIIKFNLMNREQFFVLAWG